MPPEIIYKLQRQLVKGVVDEAHVVYVMVEIRKLMDHFKRKTDFPWLSLFCDWIVHTGIERKHEAAEWLLQNFDEMVKRESNQDGFTMVSGLSFSIPFARRASVSVCSIQPAILHHGCERRMGSISWAPFERRCRLPNSVHGKRNVNRVREAPHVDERTSRRFLRAHSPGTI
jgi:hypothetical protein